MAIQDYDYIPSWDQINTVWALQSYVRNHPQAGDETKSNSEQWTRAFAAVDELETVGALNAKRRRKHL